MVEQKQALSQPLQHPLALSIAAYPFGLAQLSSNQPVPPFGRGCRQCQLFIVEPCDHDLSRTQPDLLTRTDIVLTDAKGAAKFIVEPGCRIVFIGSTIRK